MIRNLILAERSPLTGKTFCVEKELEKFFLSPPVKAIWLDSFWWIFHERYKPDKEIQNKLFDRIALNYASLLYFGPGSFYERAILKRLPTLLSQGLYTSFCCCFSQSWLSTHEFKSAICDTMGLWFSGIYPSPQSYSNWNYAKLDPERHRRVELMSPGKYVMKDSSSLWKDTSSVPSQRRPTVTRSSRFRKPHMQVVASERPVSSGTKSEDSFRTQDTYTPKEPQRLALASRKATQQVKNISEARWQAESGSKQSHPACKNPKMEKYLFNVCAKSPLVLHFLLRYSSVAQHGEDVLITRWEPGRGPPESSLTYRDIIRLALSNMIRRRNRVTQLHQRHQQGWQSFDRHLRELWKDFQRELKDIDRKEAEMRKKAHQFLLSQTSSKPTIKQTRESDLKEFEFILRRYHSRNARYAETLLSKIIQPWGEPPVTVTPTSS
ncbi:protein FAM227A [Sorex araneus]|uniref:protein FAM227A n=1 Tax=Sorex araneus TaxID=42254 RepID=UPI0024334203|nr:protein FAM227A [Sorex araneus]